MTTKTAPKPLPYKDKGDLTKGPVPGHLIRLTIPMIWGLLSVISVQLADTYFISLLGTEKLAAISFTFPVTMILTHLIFGLNIATASVVARLIGEKKREDVRRVVQHGVLMAFMASATIALICYIFLDPLFTALGADETALATIKRYMPFWLIGFAFIAVPMNGNSAIRAGGDTTLPAIVMMSVAFINVVLDPILIFGLLGFPALGVQGAALATLCAYIWGLVLGLYFLIVKKDLICLDSLHLDKVKDSLKRLLVIAIPAGITNIIMPATNAAIITLLAAYGPEAVAAFGVVSRIEAFAMLAVIALAIGMAPVIGQNWGAKIYSRVHQTINMAIGFNLIWSFTIALLFGLFAKNIAGLFSDDPAVIYYATLFFWIVPFSYAFGNLVFGWSSAFNALGMPERSFVMIVTKAALIVLGVFIGSWFLGVMGIFIALAVVNVVAGIFFHIISWRTCLYYEDPANAPART